MSIQVAEDLVLDIPLTGVPVIHASSMILGLKVSNTSFILGAKTYEYK